MEETLRCQSSTLFHLTLHLFLPPSPFLFHHTHTSICCNVSAPLVAQVLTAVESLLEGGAAPRQASVEIALGKLTREGGGQRALDGQ